MAPGHRPRAWQKRPPATIRPISQGNDTIGIKIFPKALFCFILRGKNILRCFCFILASAAAMTAVADSPSTAGAAERMVSVVSADQRTGRLVRSVVVTTRRDAPGTVVRPTAPAPASSAPPAPVNSAPAIAEAVERAATQHSLPPELIHSVIKVESNYNPAAV